MRMLLAPIAALYAVLTVWSVTANNGDLMYLESLYHHVFVLGRPWGEFVFTEATFLFPDALVYFALRAIAASQPAATAGYAILSVITTLTLVARLYRRNWPGRDRDAAALAIAFVALGLSLVHRLNLTLFWPNHHGALLIVWLALVGPGPRRAKASIALAGAAALTTFSDGVAVIQVFVPLSIYWASRRNIRAAIVTAAGSSAGGSMLILAKATQLIRVHTSTIWPTGEQLAYQFAHLAHTVGEWLGETWIFSALIVAVICAGAAAAKAPDHNRRPTRGLLSAFVITIAVTVLSALAMGRLLDVYAIRYISNCYALVAIGAALFALPHLVSRYERAAALVISSCLVGGIGVDAWRGFAFFGRDLTECVARAAPAGAYGLAGFWPAKLITFTGGPRVDQVGAGHTKYLWMNAESWYRAGARFVVTDDQLTTDVAQAWYGSPARAVTCDAAHQVLIYPAGLPEPADPADAP